MGPGFFIFFQDVSLGGDDAPTPENPTLIVYDELPTKTVKKLNKKVKKYKASKREIDQEAVNAIVDSMVDTWESQDMQLKMDQYKLDEMQAILAYKATLRELLQDDLALLLIFMEV